MGSVRPEGLVVDALRDYLLANLPAKVSAVNALRAPVLKSAFVGPFNVPVGASLQIAQDAIDTGFNEIDLTPGAARTAAQVAADIAGVVIPGGWTITAAADSDGRLVLTGAAPSGLSRAISIGADVTGANAVFGWDAGGERVVKAPLAAPTLKGVCDGWPVGSGPAPDLGPGFWVVIGDRASIPVEPQARRDEHNVAVSLEVMWKDTNTSAHRDRSHISDCVRCVRELLLSTVGRQLGRASAGDVMFVQEKQCVIAATPVSFQAPQSKRFNVLFDMATLTITVRVNERPDLS